MEVKKFKILVSKYLDETINWDERKVLVEMLKQEEFVKELDEQVMQELMQKKYELEPDEQIRESISDFLVNNTSSEKIVRFPSWTKVAAVIFVLLTAGYLLTTREKQASPITAEHSGMEDFKPGSDRAVLHLSDGTTILLDSQLNGTIARQGDVEIVKSANGQISYQLLNQGNTTAYMNTMTTPMGGQYRLVLPDGTKVWLNAASSITYPASFQDKERKVSVSGEVYFEVAKNADKPFIVDVDGGAKIEVLGTHFNVNAYANEPAIKISLLEGSVKSGGIVLQPGQALINGKVITTDLERDVAWKNGLFNFNGLDLPTAMRQLARWYSLEVKFEGGVPNKVIRGKMGRDLSLSQVLNILEKMELNFRIEQKTLIVTP